MKVKISLGNTKMGKMPSVSLPPIKACGNCKACAKHCYAMKAYRQYPAVKAAYDNKYELAINNGGEYFVQIDQYLQANKPKLFRWHVAGDILSLPYFSDMVTVALDNPKTKFLVFTKMHNIVNEFLKYNELPKNLKVFFSVWLGERILTPKGVSIARTVNKGDLDHYTGFKCEGNCEQCGFCFEAKNGSTVIFEMH